MLSTSSLWLALALSLATIGMAWFAVAKEVHWQQVLPTVAFCAMRARKLQWAGALALLGSLGSSLAADHPSMAALVWIMSIGTGAVLVALLLAWKPFCLKALMVLSITRR